MCSKSGKKEEHGGNVARATAAESNRTHLGVVQDWRPRLRKAYVHIYIYMYICIQNKDKYAQKIGTLM